MANLATADRAREFPPVAPTVHSNGTSGMALYDGLSEVVHALDNAWDALKRAAPNGRDYYIQPARGDVPTLELAIQQHERRQRVIQALIDEIDEEREAIRDQID